MAGCIIYAHNSSLHSNVLFPESCSHLVATTADAQRPDNCPSSG